MLKYSDYHACVYSTQSFGVYNYGYEQRCLLQEDVDNLIHVDAIKSDVILVCSKGSQSLDLWKCSWNSWSTFV